MLKLMKDLPDNVLGVSAEGKVSGKDYKTILIPAIEDKLKTYKKIRFLYQLGNEFTGFEPGAIIEDTFVGMNHLAAWDRIVLVSDHKMIDIFVEFFGHMIPCEVRIFRDSDLEKAKKWITEK